MREWYPSDEGPTVPTRPAPARPLPPTSQLPIVPPSPPVRTPPLLLTVPIAGGAWWAVGGSALHVGVATVVLAAGLGITVWLAITLRRRFGAGAPLPPGGRSRLFTVVAVAAVLGVGAEIGLGYLGYGEVAVPLACAVVGLALFSLASVLDDRAWLALGGALLLLAALGAVLALDSASDFYPRGMVGMVAGALFWLLSALRGRLFGDARTVLRR